MYNLIFIFSFLLSFISYGSEPLFIFSDTLEDDKSSFLSTKNIKLGAQGEELNSLLDQQVSLEISQSGGPGQPGAFYLRGMGSSDFKVYLDDVDISDASSIGSRSFIEHFSSDIFSSVQINKKSTLKKATYGGGGYINLVTLDGGEDKNSARISYGSYNTKNLGLSSVKNWGNISSIFAFQGTMTDGFSAYKGGSENDPYQRFNYLGKLKHKNKDQIIGFTFFRSNSKTEYDDFGKDKLDDDLSRYQQSVYSLSYSNAYWEGLYWPQINVSFQQVDRQSGQSYQSENKSISLINDFLINAKYKFILRANYRDVSSQYYQGYEGLDLLAQLERTWTKDILTLGVGTFFNSMFEHNQSFELTYKHEFLPGIIASELTFVKNFKVPSLFQLYDPTYGNENLQMSNLLSSEVSLIVDHLKVSFFNREVENEITYSQNTYVNAQQVHYVGAELEYSLRLGKNFEVQGSYANLYTKNVSTGQPLARRPREKMNLFLTRNFGNKGLLRFKTRYTSSREDMGKLPSYTLFDLEGMVNFNKYIQFNARIENIFDKDYEQVRTYGTAGRSFYLGLVANI